MQNDSDNLVTYKIEVHHETGSYWAKVNELPGCYASGDTMDELWENLVEAINLYLSDSEQTIRMTPVGPEETVTEVEKTFERVLVG